MKKQNKPQTLRELRKKFREILLEMDITELTRGVDELWLLFKKGYEAGKEAEREKYLRPMIEDGFILEITYQNLKKKRIYRDMKIVNLSVHDLQECEDILFYMADLLIHNFINSFKPDEKTK